MNSQSGQWQICSAPPWVSYRGLACVWMYNGRGADLTPGSCPACQRVKGQSELWGCRSHTGKHFLEWFLLWWHFGAKFFLEHWFSNIYSGIVSNDAHLLYCMKKKIPKWANHFSQKGISPFFWNICGISDECTSSFNLSYWIALVHKITPEINSLNANALNQHSHYF